MLDKMIKLVFKVFVSKLSAGIGRQCRQRVNSAHLTFPHRYLDIGLAIYAWSWTLVLAFFGRHGPRALLGLSANIFNDFFM